MMQSHPTNSGWVRKNRSYGLQWEKHLTRTDFLVLLFRCLIGGAQRGLNVSLYQCVLVLSVQGLIEWGSLKAVTYKRGIYGTKTSLGGRNWCLRLDERVAAFSRQCRVSQIERDKSASKSTANTQNKNEWLFSYQYSLRLSDNCRRLATGSKCGQPLLPSGDWESVNSKRER